ncbi:MAG: GNAT family N-acetyltransferase [Thermomicrobiales bacterium]
MSRAATLAVVRTVLAADCACPASAFTEDGLLLTPAAERAGRRRYPLPAKELRIVTMGRGVVVSCHPAWIDSLRSILAGNDRDMIFTAPTIAELARFVAPSGEALRGPAVSYVCAPGFFRPAADPSGVIVTVVEGEAVYELYQYPGFGHALSYQPDHPRPDVAAAVARRAGEIVGIAGMSADCETLWQIGIEVVTSARGAGIGRALVGRLTELAFQHNRVPFYTADVANLRSHALAVSLGFWPTWVELFARDASPDGTG